MDNEIAPSEPEKSSSGKLPRWFIASLALIVVFAPSAGVRNRAMALITMLL